MDEAAIAGHLAVVKFFHENRQEGCTKKAMDEAAKVEHLDVVKFLHANRRECCTTMAMFNAARAGHFDIIKFLHENRQEGCIFMAMDDAAFKRHFQIVKFLHESRTEGCEVNTLFQEFTRIVEFLCVRHPVVNPEPVIAQTKREGRWQLAEALERTAVSAKTSYIYV